MNYFFEAKDNNGFSDSEINAAIKQAIADLGPLKKVLLIPPDITRLNAYAGPITKMYYDALPADCEVEIMPALGTHMPMNKEEIEFVFPGLPSLSSTTGGMMWLNWAKFRRNLSLRFLKIVIRTRLTSKSTGVLSTHPMI